jgi:hypothetical protein
MIYGKNNVLAATFAFSGTPESTMTVKKSDPNLYRKMC